MKTTQRRRRNSLPARGAPVLPALLAAFAFIAVPAAAFAENTGGMCGDDFGKCSTDHGDGASAPGAPGGQGEPQ